MLRLIALTFFILANLWRFGWQTEADTQARTDSITTRVIYGEDDRIEFFEIDNPIWFERARSTVALFDKDDLIMDKQGINYLLQSDPFGLSHHLCEDEAFYDQPVGSFCSGFLIDTDIVVTAGHCIRNKYNCENVRLVFGYQYFDADNDPLITPKEDVYRCAQIIHTQNVGPTGADFAILRLDREVEDRIPLYVRNEGEVGFNDHFTVVGYPKGLPGKFAHGGSLRANDSDIFFVTDVDTFDGNSGSAVFNSDTGVVEGLLVRGEKDFTFDLNSGCYRAFTCAQDGCRGEDVVRITEVLKHLPRKEFYSSND
jgi:hypothetical protein